MTIHGRGFHMRRSPFKAGVITGTARSAATLTRTSGPTTYPPTVSFSRPVDWVDGDYGIMRWSTDATFASGVTESPTPRQIYAATSSYDFGLSAITSGSYFMQIAAWTGTRPGSLNWSNIQNVGDTVAPTITSTASPTGYQYVSGTLALTASEGVTWAITGGADAAAFSIAGSTLSWVASTASGVSRAVQVTATDYAGNATNQTITLANSANQPTGVSFTPVTGATLSTGYQSNTITLGGGTGSPVWPWAFTGTGTLYKNGVSAGTSGTAVATDQFYVTETSSGVNSTSVSGTLTVGTTASTYTVTTVGGVMTFAVLTPPAAQGTTAGDMTFTACDFSTAASNRAILVYVDGYAGGTAITSVTIGGVAATRLATPGSITSAWIANVPTGTTGNIVCSAGGAAWNGGRLIGYAIYGANIVPASIVVGNNNGYTTWSGTTPTGGATFAFVAENVTTATTFSGAADDGSYTIPAFGTEISRAHYATAGAYSIATTNNYYNGSNSLAISFGP